jgi:hypothetical protein
MVDIVRLYARVDLLLTTNVSKKQSKTVTEGNYLDMLSLGVEDYSFEQ